MNHNNINKILSQYPQKNAGRQSDRETPWGMLANLEFPTNIIRFQETSSQNF